MAFYQRSFTIHYITSRHYYSAAMFIYAMCVCGTTMFRNSMDKYCIVFLFSMNMLCIKYLYNVHSMVYNALNSHNVLHLFQSICLSSSENNCNVDP